jgi:glycosyltransferase involved in cell wall biosynthesis
VSRQRELLLVAQLSPPSTLVAARRVAGLTKYLARLGHRVTVLTSSVSGQGSIESAARIARTADLLTSPLNWRRKHFETLGGVRSGGYKRPSRVESVVVPDLALLGWIPFALFRAHALQREVGFDCVLTSSPPSSAHLVGLSLRRRHAVPWIAELRDGWTFEPPRRAWPLGPQRWADRRLEHAVVSRADGVVAVTQPIVDDLRRRLGVDARLVTNGFDPEEARTGSIDGLLDPSRHSLVHTGRMAIAGSTPAPLLDAVRALKRNAPELAEGLELVFAGPLTLDEQELLGEPDLAGTVRWVGALDHDRSLALQRAADTLVVVTEGSSRRSVATGKLFEYLGAGKPIIVLGEETEAARIVSEARAGVATSASDPQAIAHAIRTVVVNARPEPAEEAVQAYAYPRIAGRLAALIDEICG